MLRSILFVGALALSPVATQAQVTKPAPAAAVPASSGAAAQPGERCLRLPLSDVAFGTDNATNAARVKLAEYAEQETRKRKWPAKPLVKSRETVSCEVYLNLGPIGTEYRCLVTATFCQK